MAILRLLPSDGTDEDGDDNNAVRRVALQLCAREIDDLTDLELFSRVTDDGAFANFCIEELHRLPSEVDMGCREWTLIQARSFVRQAQQQLIRQFSDVKTGFES